MCSIPFIRLFVLSLTAFAQPMFNVVLLNSSYHLCIWQVNICSVETEREETAGGVVPELCKGLAENWLGLLFYARCKIKIFLRKLQLGFFPHFGRERSKKNYIKMRKKNQTSTKVLSCFVWGAVKTTKIHQVKVVSPEINKIRASVISIAGELSSSKHIWTIDPCSHI